MKKHDQNTPKKESPGRVTMVDIAKTLGISHTTVSLSLRNHPRISAAMRSKVKQAADEMGYRPDPMLSALSHYRTGSKIKPVQAELAWINTWKNPDQLRQAKEFDLYWEGAEDSARRLGFRLREFRTRDIPLPRLQSILNACNIHGLLIAPLEDSLNDWLSFPWSDYAVVRFGKRDLYPPTYMVSSNQIANTMLAFDKILELGYERIGFVCEFWPNRFHGAGFSWAQRNLPKMQRLPLLTFNLKDEPKQHQIDLGNWIKKTKPDAIYTDGQYLPELLTNLGYRIPEDIGLATTSIHDTPIDAGIDQNPKEIGRAAIRALSALMHENNYGIPAIGNEILVKGHWIEGSMLPDRN